MRLGQAARKFETTTDRLVSLLKEHFRTVNDHPNIKLTDEEVSFFESTFETTDEPEKVLKPVELPADEIQKEEPAKLVPEEEQQEDVAQPQFVESLRPQVFTLEDEFTEKTKALEKFKAEKPELDGLKVVGKIDLPEPKPKPVKETTVKENRPRRERSKRSQNNGTNTAAEERKKAERIAKRKKIEAEKRAQALKKKHYEENVKAKLQPPAPKKRKKKTVKPTAPEQVKKVHSTHKRPAKKATGLKRFWLWLNGAYDKHD